ncbi:MAG: tRNA (adenosine(37)-N6)-dimethylallyltransferase MiaA [Candidatus Nealsonbacteria bacterium]|nr:tRNA (adenosine(37)-N6)-dimethylallyltransferase MiaA [Candidatus Nealsonbacteria bacterium]
MSKKALPPLIVVLGPTASGKTGTAIKLAKEFDGEIVSADSRQVYKEMDIGTAKPTKKEKKEVPHHLVDFISLKKEFNVATYKEMAVKAIKDILDRNKTPFLVGGTGLYIKAVIDNFLFPDVKAQKQLREKLKKKTKNELFETYKELDPKGAKEIQKENKRRLIRAIEVSQKKGGSFWSQRKRGDPLFDSLQIGLKRPRKELRERIDQRTEKMFEKGLEKEVKGIYKKYGSSPLLETIGYQEWMPYLEKNKKIRTEDRIKIKAGIKLHTLQFTKRQMTWFKKDKRIYWVEKYKEAEKLVKEFLQKKSES